MKGLRFLVSVMMISAFLMPLAACVKAPELDFGSSQPEFNDTGIYLAKNGATEYKIVMPAEAKNKELAAAEELKLFFEQATEATIEVIDDTDIAFTQSSKYISIGETVLAREGGLSVPQSLGISGFYLKNIGNTLFIAGQSEYGTLYGVYGFLEYNLGVKMYGFDECLVPKNRDVLLKDYDYSEVPTFDYRCLEGGNRLIGYRTQDRLRENGLTGYLPGLGSHSTMVLVPNSAANVASHPEWFANSSTVLHGNELCLTNEGAYNELLKNLKARRVQYAKSYPYADCAMIGVMDTIDSEVWCNCAACQQSNSLYTKTGTYIRFVNRVAAAMKEWEQENGYKSFSYGVFAYGKSQAAPVTHSAETSLYTPVHESVIPAENVVVRFAPLHAIYNRSLTDGTYNAGTKAMIESWSSLVSSFKVWSYCLNYSQTMIWFNDFFTMKDHYTVYKNMGVNEIFDQMVYNVVVPAFNNLRIYVKNKLMWNLQQDPSALAYDFIDNFYKDGAPYMKELFDLVNMRFLQIDKEILKDGGLGLQTRTLSTYEPQILSDFYWPHDFLLQCENLVSKALAEVGKVEDASLRATLEERIKMEAVSVKYLMLELHSSQFTARDYESLINEFESDCALTGVNSTAEAMNPISNAVARYRAKLGSM